MKRGNPTQVCGPCDVQEDAHERKLSEMHDALYSLGNKIRKPYESRGDKLLPKDLRSAEPAEAKVARAHIDTLHKAFKSEK